MNLGGIDTDMAMLRECLSMLDEIQAKADAITAKVAGGATADSTTSEASTISGITETSVDNDLGGSGNLSLRQQVRTINVLMMTIEKATGESTISGGIQKVQEFIQIAMRLNMVLFVLSELQAGIIGGPLGWMYAGANVVAFVSSTLTLGQ